MNQNESLKPGCSIMRAIPFVSAIWWIVLWSGGWTLICAEKAWPADTKHRHESLNIVPFDADRWYLSNEAEIVSFGGRKALTGTAYLKDVDFLNGTIEADVWITGETANFAGFIFRVQSLDDFEWCLLRTHKTNGRIQDAIQYAPVYKGLFCWQLNGGPGGIGPVSVPRNEWVHMKMEILNDSAALYVKDMSKSVIVMELQRDRQKGSVGLQTYSPEKVGVYVSNFAYQLDEMSKPAPPKKKIIPPYVLTKWQLSPYYQVRDFGTISIYPTRRLTEIREWITPDVDVSGLVNISKYYGRPGYKGPLTSRILETEPDCAILRTYIDARQDKRVKMNFGYSDAATIFLNQAPLFWGNSAYLSRNKAYGGWISFNDAVFLNLKKGMNELLVVVAEKFGGWGFQARLEDVDGIKIHSKSAHD